MQQVMCRLDAVWLCGLQADSRVAPNPTNCGTEATRIITKYRQRQHKEGPRGLEEREEARKLLL
jgi:hypothetical protein